MSRNRCRQPARQAPPERSVGADVRSPARAHGGAERSRCSSSLEAARDRWLHGFAVFCTARTVLCTARIGGAINPPDTASDLAAQFWRGKETTGGGQETAKIPYIESSLG